MNYSKTNDFFDLGSHYGGTLYKVLNLNNGKFILMKFLSKTRIYTTMLDDYIKKFLGRENANLVTLINYKKTQ